MSTKRAWELNTARSALDLPPDRGTCCIALQSPDPMVKITKTNRVGHRVIVEPSRPGGPLIISDVQAESVSLSWKPPSEDGGGSILGYLIEAKDVLHMDIHKTYIWSEGPQTEFLVTGLQTSHIYQFRVYAQNEAGKSEALLNKNVIRIKAAIKKPPSPTTPVAEIQDDESVLLKWSVRDDSSDVNFIIERCETKSDLWMQCNHELVMRTSYLLTGLIPGKKYKFRITSENTHGVSKPSEESEPVQLKDDEGEPPTIIVPVTDCFVKEEDSAVFKCEYSGTQPISVNWSKDGIRIREGFGVSIVTEITKSILTLDEIESDDDECSVQCDLRNFVGKASSQAKIKLLSPPKWNCPSSYKNGMTYDAEDSLRLKMHFTGTPNPKIKCVFNKKHLIPDDRTQIIVNDEFIELRICDLRHTDAGIYEFVAENEIGKDSAVVPVTVAGPPSPPSGFPSVEMVSEDEALLKWNIPDNDGGSSVFNYIVEILKQENKDWERFAVVHDTYLLTTDATLCKMSVFRIRAVNIFGESEPSQESQFFRNINYDIEIEAEQQLSFVPRDKAYETHDIDVKCLDAGEISDAEIDEETVLNHLQIIPVPTDKGAIDDDTDLKKEVVTEISCLLNDDVYDQSKDAIISVKTGDMEDRCDSLLLVEGTNKNIGGRSISLNILDDHIQEDLQLQILKDRGINTITIPIAEADGIQEGVKLDTETTDKTENTNSQQDLDVVTVRKFGSKSINKAFSVVELHECELTCPMEIMYFEVQTLLSLPILNFACLDTFESDEVRYFSASIIPLEEYLVQSIDHILCYTICSFTIVLEVLFPEDVLPMKSVDASLCVQCHEYYIQNYHFTIYFGRDEPYEYILNDKKAKAWYIENTSNMIHVTENVYCNNFIQTQANVNYAKVSTHNSIRETAVTSLETCIFDSLVPFFIDSLLDHFLTISLVLCNSTVVCEQQLLCSAELFDIQSNIERALSITHIPEELTTLAGLKCVPLTSFKPALSVLPMSRTLESETDQRNDRIRTPFLSEAEKNKLFCDISSQQKLDLPDKVIVNFDTCIKCGLTNMCLCNILSGNIDLCVKDNNFIVSSIENNDINRFEIQRKKKKNVDRYEATNNIPNWLRFVSPSYLQSAEEIVDETFNDFDDDKLTAKESITENEIAKNKLKNYSVQELLDLAQQVERSFSEKAEHIESLENILKEELSSLEKDLEAVHKINQTFCNESEVSWLDSSSSVGQDSKTWDECITAEKDLIDFKKDVPLTRTRETKEMKQGEYAPHIITHLQNRVVQCGCRTRLYCSISGNPDPQIAWLKNGKILCPSSRYLCSNLVEFGLYIDIFNAKSSDIGEYMCVATNCHGSAQTQAFLTVLGDREYSPEEPKFISSPNDKTVTEGEFVTLQWKVAGTPVPHVMWFKNAERINTSLKIDTFSNHRGCCRLVLRDVTKDDGAIYTCYLENEAGSAISTVQVTVGDVCTKSTCNDNPESDSTLRNLLALQSQESNIPSVKDIERLLNKKRTQCEADGLVKARPRKRINILPGPPFAPKVLNYGKSWAVLSWLVPLNWTSRRRNLMYLIEKRRLEGTRWKEVVRTPYTIYTVAGLKKGRSYLFRVSAGTPEGWGPPLILMETVHFLKDGRTVTTYDDQIAFEL